MGVIYLGATGRNPPGLAIIPGGPLGLTGYPGAAARGRIPGAPGLLPALGAPPGPPVFGGKLSSQIVEADSVPSMSY